ncbi:MAG TPA: hypothetical protein VFW49_01105 [Fluviicoccus sp.]|nr:hypothetical protein [Fluviicoccus sp.]
MNGTPLSPRAEALLNAQIAYMIRRLTGDEYEAWVRAELEADLQNARLLTLNEAMEPRLIKEVVHQFALELDLSGGVLELVAAVARALHAHPVHASTTLGDILSDGSFEEMLDKVLELRDVRERLVHEVVSNPLYAELATSLLTEGVRGYLDHAVTTTRLPGARSLARFGREALQVLPGGLEEALESRLHDYLRRALQGLLASSGQTLLELADTRLRDSILDIWDVLKTRPLADGLHQLTALDLEEFFVLGYEYWREVRQTDFVRSIIDSGIDTFFELYGETSLYDLLGEVGIDHEIMVQQAMRFGPPVIAVLHERGMLEALFRRQLEGFFASPEVAAILAAGETT